MTVLGDLTTPLPVRCFLSYAHVDDEDFQIVDPLKKTLSALFEANTGRPLKIFVDRDSIGWGNDWREVIGKDVTSATFFILLFTARYAASNSCREELLAFYSKSEALGVTKLILPLILAGSQLLSVDSGDEVVRIMASLQYRSLEESWADGYESPKWRSTIRQLAAELKEINDSVEQKLADHEEEVINLDDPSDGGDVASPDAGPVGEDEDGAFDLLFAFQEDVKAMTVEAEALSSFIIDLGDAANQSASTQASSDPKQVQKQLVLMANRLKNASSAIQTHGLALNQEVVKADSHLRSLVNLAKDSGVDELNSSVQLGVASIVNDLGELSAVGVQMEEMLQSLRPMEILSASLRKSLAPARSGITNIRDAINIIEEWQGLIQESVKHP